MDVVVHLPESDPAYGSRVLRNVANLLADDTLEVTVSIVANGGGVSHLVTTAAGSAAVRDLIDDGVEVCACSNTIANADYDEDDLVEGIRVVSSGMAELARNQADGAAYIRP